MNSRVPFRSLLTTTSVAALLVASTGAHAVGIDIVANPAAPITADTDYVSIQTLLTNSIGVDGLVISGSETEVESDVSVTASAGGIDIDDVSATGSYDGTLFGIFVEDSAEIYGEIDNYGSIDVDAGYTGSGGGGREAAGIYATEGSYNHGVENYGSINVDAVVSRYEDGYAEGTSSYSADATAFGVRQMALGGSFYNSGTISVGADATARAAADDGDGEDEDASAEAYASASAYAAGVEFENVDAEVTGDHDFDQVVEDIQNENTITAIARGEIGAYADVGSECSGSCSAFGSAFADAYGDLEVNAFGVNVLGGASAAEGLYNEGSISATAQGGMFGTADANSEFDDAIARAGRHRYNFDEEYYDTDYFYADVTAHGVHFNVLQLDGDIVNDDEISAIASVTSHVQAEAHADNTAEAEVGVYSDVTARGVYVDALVVTGNFDNDGRIEAAASLTYHDGEDGAISAAAYGDEAEADVNVSGSLLATGVDFEVLSMVGNFVNSGEGEDGGIYSSIVVDVEAQAIASGDEGDVDASVSASFSALAEGMDLNIDSLAGQFINDGIVDSQAEIDITVGAYSDSNYEGSAEAYIYADTRAEGIDVGIDTLTGSFNNFGSIYARVDSTTLAVAEAEGSDDIEAHAEQYSYASVVGINADISYLQDNFRNEGSVDVDAAIKQEFQVSANIDESEYGNAAAIAFGRFSDSVELESYVTGLDLNFGAVGGHIYNGGEVDVEVVASQSIDAHAEAGDTGDAYAVAGGISRIEARGISLSIGAAGVSLDEVEDVSEGDGTFYNDGDIDVAATANINYAASAEADDGSAVAIAEYTSDFFEDLDGDVSAIGIYVSDNEGYGDFGNEGFVGDVINDGNIDATASINAEVTATVDVDEGDEEDTVAAAGAGGFYGSSAAGFTLDGVDVGGLVSNTNEINAYARADVAMRAAATSDEGPAGAFIVSDMETGEDDFLSFDDPALVYSAAIGFNAMEAYFEESFLNDGYIRAEASTDLIAEADAHGDEYATAVAAPIGYAYAVGVALVDVYLDDSFTNQGEIVADANAVIESDARAYGDEAVAVSTGMDFSGGGYAMAAGVLLQGGEDTDFFNAYSGEDDYFEDGGAIYATAEVASDIYAYADGISSAAASAAHQDSVSAVGVHIEGAYAYGSFVNQGLIYASALRGDDESSVGVEAFAETQGGSASADAEHSVQVSAIGVDTDSGTFANSGYIIAEATGHAFAYAHADGNEGDESANADARADVHATGVLLYGEDWEDGSFSNTNLIAASADAYAEAIAEADASSSELSADASATALAYGVHFDEGAAFDTISNSEDGEIESYAYAGAIETENGGEDTGSSEASAYGMRLQNTYFNTLTNDGLIHAEAEASDTAYAVGISVDGNSSTHAGAIVNNGTIEVEAQADDPYATAIGVYEGGRISSITNTGTISATINDLDEFEGEDGSGAIAIDLRGSGLGTAIHQLDGAVTGDVRMDQGGSALADAINWSGGTITGDIFGDYEEDDINIFVGEDDSFTYEGTIDGLNRLGLNYGEYDDAVTLRLTNVVRNAAEVHVGANAVMNLGTAATIGTDHLNLDASAMLVFDLTSEGANGVINTTTADLGDATVKANFVSPWLPDSQVYRIINWDGDSETRFGSVISSSILERVVAEYGEDGVDLLATRLQFADLTGLEDDATSFGLALDRIFDDIDPDSDLGQAILLLIQLTPDQFAYEMSQIAGQQTADVQHVTLSQLGSLIHVIQTQINDTRHKTTGGASGDGIALRLGGDSFSVSSGDDFGSQSGVAAGDETAKGDWSAWARVFGDWAKLDASGTAQGFKADSGGVVVGADYAISDAVTLGLAGGYQTSDLTFGNAGDGDIESWSVSAYGDYRIGNAYIDMLVGYAAQTYDMNRAFSVLGTNYIANSQYDGSSIIGAIEAGYEFALSDKTTLTPFVGFNGNQTKTDASIETGGGIWNLAYGDRSETRFDTVLGARVSHDFVTDDGMTITPTFELGWKHGFGDMSPTANASLAGTPGTQFQIFGSPASKDAAIVGTALKVQMSEELDVYVQYNGQLSSDFTENTASLRLRWSF